MIVTWKRIWNLGAFFIGASLLYSLFDRFPEPIFAVIGIAVGWEIYEYAVNLKKGKETYFFDALLDIIARFIGGGLGIYLTYLFIHVVPQ